MLKNLLGELTLAYSLKCDEQENLQDRVDVLAENLEKVRQDNLELEEEIAGLKAQKIDLVNHLNTAIKRINDIHQWIKDNFP